MGIHVSLYTPTENDFTYDTQELLAKCAVPSTAQASTKRARQGRTLQTEKKVQGTPALQASMEPHDVERRQTQPTPLPPLFVFRSPSLVPSTRDTSQKTTSTDVVKDTQ